MATRIYILLLEGEPQYATTDLQKIKNECQDWYDGHSDVYDIQRDFNWWIEGRDYPNTDEGEDAAWCDYVEEQFENGTWGDYAWYECYLK